MLKLALSFLAGTAIGAIALVLTRTSAPALSAVALSHSAASAPVAIHVARPAASSIPDPLFPHRLLRIRAAPGPDSEGLSSRQPPPADLKPLVAQRVERSVEERGGIDPCRRPDPGYGIFTHWQYPRGFGRLLVPRERPVDAEGRFDFIAHFHGADLARLEYVRADVPIALLAVRANRRGSYAALSGPNALDAVVGSVERAVAKQSATGQARAEHVALASWSGGFSGIKLILQYSNGWERVGAVILFDSLHTARDAPDDARPLRHFVKFAKRAAAGKAFMFVSYSSIMTDDFASTTESARMLIAQLGGYPLPAEGDGPGGMQLKEVFSRGNFHARGYLGGGKLDHCAHLLLYPEVAEALHRHWHGQ
jgi:hypothetical protein